MLHENAGGPQDPDRPSAMQDSGNEVPRISLPRTSVHKGYESLQLGRSDTLPDQVGGPLHAPEQYRARA
jgi:hypothetical protein